MRSKASTREEWRGVTNYPIYEVSSLGNVRSVGHFRRHPLNAQIFNWRSGKQLRPQKGQWYLHVSLVRNVENVSVRKTELIHRLVAKAFLPNPECKPCVNHIDGNKHNNKLTNLEWCTYSENEQHSFSKLGKIVWNKGKKTHHVPWNKGLRYSREQLKHLGRLEYAGKKQSRKTGITSMHWKARIQETLF